MKKSDRILIWVVIGIAALLNFRFPGAFRFDQDVIKYSIARDGYPSFNFGVGIFWIVELINFVFHPANDFIRQVIFKVIAGTAFLLPAAFLGRKLLTSNWAFRIYLFSLLFCLYPFLWLSTELFLSGSLTLFFYLISLKRPPLVWTTLVLLMVGLIKVEMVLVSAALLVFWMFQERSKEARIRVLGTYAAGFVLLHGMGILWIGTAYFTKYSSRSLMAILQHYSALFFKHQVASPVPPAFDGWEAWQKAIFPRATSTLQLIFHYPIHYMDFVALSTARGLRNLVRLFGPALLILILRGSPSIKAALPVRRFEKWFCVSFIGILPMVLLSYPHVRYLARYYPLLSILILSALESPKIPGWFKKTGYVCVLGMIAMQIGIAVYYWKRFDPHDLFWFSD